MLLKKTLVLNYCYSTYIFKRNKRNINLGNCEFCKFIDDIYGCALEGIKQNFPCFRQLYKSFIGQYIYYC